MYSQFKNLNLLVAVLQLFWKTRIYTCKIMFQNIYIKNEIAFCGSTFIHLTLSKKLEFI